MFDGAVWDHADLTDTVFVGCEFAAPNLNDAVLTGARFSQCRLTRAAFTHADLRETAFEDCVFADPATQQGVSFAFARLDEARFERCDLTHGRFESADLYAAVLRDCNLLGARFGRACFHRAFGRTVVRASVTFNDCRMDLADLSGAHLAGCDFTRSRLLEADLSEADLTGAILAGADFFQAMVDGAKLADADLRGAEVSGLDLRRLASYQNLKIDADQQYRLLDAMGLDVRID